MPERTICFLLLAGGDWQWRVESWILELWPFLRPGTPDPSCPRLLESIWVPLIPSVLYC